MIEAERLVIPQAGGYYKRTVLGDTEYIYALKVDGRSMLGNNHVIDCHIVTIAKEGSSWGKSCIVVEFGMQFCELEESTIDEFETAVAKVVGMVLSPNTMRIMTGVQS